MNNREISQKIFEDLNKRGAGLGDVSVFIIHRSLYECAQKEQHESLQVFLKYCDEAGWIKNIDSQRIINDFEKSELYPKQS